MLSANRGRKAKRIDQGLLRFKVGRPRDELMELNVTGENLIVSRARVVQEGAGAAGQCNIDFCFVRI